MPHFLGFGYSDIVFQCYSDIESRPSDQIIWTAQIGEEFFFINEV